MPRVGWTTWLLLAASCLPAVIALALPPASGPPPQASAAPVPGPSAAPAPGPASAPAASPDPAPAAGAEGEPADLVKEALSYDDLEEQVRFAVACGEKRELSESAFEENRKHHSPFARRFDRWDQIVLFDRNGNGTISWTEAAQYRAALRKALLAAYDADRDGQLAGDERLAANKALAEGKLPPLKPPAPASRPADPAGGP